MIRTTKTQLSSNDDYKYEIALYEIAFPESRFGDSPLLHILKFSGALHFWIGPAGVHIYWPDIWKSRLDYEKKWKE